MSSDGHGPDEHAQHADRGYRAVVEHYEDGPDQCTIYPVDATGEDARMATWVTARGDAFVALDEQR
jgi:hypothetical protein